MFRRTPILALVLCLLPVSGSLSYVSAHPIPRSNHDRKIQVTLHYAVPQADLPRLAGTSLQVSTSLLAHPYLALAPAPAVQIVDKVNVRVLVYYRLEVDELTVALDDMAPFSDQVDFTQYRGKPDEFYSEFMRLYAPIFAANVQAKIDGRSLTFRPVDKTHALVDEKGQALGHLRCDFILEGTAPIDAAGEHTLTFRDGTFELQTGQIAVGVAADPFWPIIEKKEAPEKLKTLPEAERPPGAEEELRRVTARFQADYHHFRHPFPLTVPAGDDAVPQPAEELPPTRIAHPAASDSASRERVEDHDPWSLSLLVLHTETVWLLLLLAAAFGAAHAVTPGHGKTLVAAYLVGERGTALHALVLGLVTTLTHTGVVLLIAVVFFFLPEARDIETRKTIQFVLGMGMGLVITGLGFWLLLRRLSGKVDHVHLGGHGHHHHHHHGHDHHHHHHDHHHHDHEQDEHGNVIPAGRKVGWWGLIALGISGGIIPCWDAVFLLCYSIGRNEFWLALPTLLAFSAGLASVLIALGLSVVWARRATPSHWRIDAFVRVLPVLSALVIIGMGFWLCYDSLYGIH